MKDEIEKYVAAIKQAYDKDQFWGQSADKHNFSVEYGKKFAKIIINSWGQNSVHCFVEIATGNILKAATWKAPAKGIRGNVNDSNPPYLSQDYYRYK